jgi:hypothetical protein
MSFFISAEAQVESALNVLEQEAGLSEETMVTLRQAVECSMSRRRQATKAQHAVQHAVQHVTHQAAHLAAHQAAQQAIANAGYSTFHIIAPNQQSMQEFKDPTGALAMVRAATIMPPGAFAGVGAPALAQTAGGSSLLATAAHAPTTPAGMMHVFDQPHSIAPRSVKPASSKRQQLTVEEAAEIYSLRPRRGDVSNGGLVHCRLLAPKYGVTPKTIRDVWSGRTWAEATRHLWTPEEKAQRDRPKAKSCAKNDTDDGSDADEDESDADARKRPKKEDAPQSSTPTHRSYMNIPEKTNAEDMTADTVKTLGPRVQR